MQKHTSEEIFQILESVKDPEIPVVSIKDLGILQCVKIKDGHITIGIIPTYSGCPAMHAIQDDIRSAMKAHNISEFSIKLLDDPVWNTNMITDQGREAMEAYGIAPPVDVIKVAIKCPQCGSSDTTCISQFGSTACKALYRCQTCLEPFDYFKCHA